jgi:hypothetical protein
MVVFRNETINIHQAFETVLSAQKEAKKYKTKV